jgi:hypothetical protein
MGIYGKVAAARPKEWTCQGIGDAAGVEFRLRQVRSADLLAHGRGALLAALPRPEGGQDKQAQAEAMLRDPRAILATQELLRATVCAGVTGTRPVGAEKWDAETFCMREADASDAHERVWIEVLPDALLAHLANAISAIGQGEVQAALATFRAGDAGGAGPGSKAVRSGPVDGHAVEPGAPGAGDGGHGGGRARGDGTRKGGRR